MKKLDINSEDVMEQIEKRLHESPDGKLFPEEILKLLPHEIAMDFKEIFDMMTETYDRQIDEK